MNLLHEHDIGMSIIPFTDEKRGSMFAIKFEKGDEFTSFWIKSEDLIQTSPEGLKGIISEYIVGLARQS